MATAKEILEYRRKANDGTIGVYYNSDILHATIIMTALLNKAREKGEFIKIFCGKLSLFSRSAEGKVNQLKEEVEKNYESTEEKEQWEGFNPSKELRDAFIAYVEKFSDKIKIIVENWTDEITKLPIWDILKENKVELRVLTSNIGLDHFTVTKDAYRIENSDEIKSASGNFMDPANAIMLEGIFDQQVSRSVKYNYN